TDAALAVADDDDRRKAEALAALHHLGDAVDANELFNELRLCVPLTALAALALRWFSHSAVPSLERQPAFAGRVGQGLVPTVINIAAAIKHDYLDALRDGAFGDELAHRLGRIDIGAGLQLALQ